MDPHEPYHPRAAFLEEPSEAGPRAEVLARYDSELRFLDRLIAENESIFIRAGEPHRLENPGKIMLELIEVQTGSYLGEDDIVRFSDNYGRS